MIHHFEENENTNDNLNFSFIATVKELDISGLLAKCGIRKTHRTLGGETSGEKRSAFEIFHFLLLMVFQGCNLYRYLGSKKQDIACLSGYVVNTVIRTRWVNYSLSAMMMCAT